jgi:hypothetical protein
MVFQCSMIYESRSYWGKNVRDGLQNVLVHIESPQVAPVGIEAAPIVDVVVVNTS